MRLANSLPTSLRRSAGKGIHDLTIRHWYSKGEEEAISSWFYLWRTLNELPLSLQAFVLRDDDGQRRETDFGMGPLSDPNHLQPYTNIDLLTHEDGELSDVISRAKDRIDREIEIVDERNALRQQQESTRRADSRSLLVMPELRRQYEIGEYTFYEVGPTSLITRARQRFFFILAAEEILNALASDSPKEKLTNMWYLELSGSAQRGHLYIQNDRVHLYPPVLFNFVVGVQVSRIRKCEICENYFWAGRKDKKVCSEQCGATKRKRKERKRYLEIKLGDRVPTKRRSSSLTRLSNRAKSSSRIKDK
jgi:predicted nucleic acid-binding Zn ribbon protein